MHASLVDVNGAQRSVDVHDHRLVQDHFVFVPVFFFLSESSNTRPGMEVDDDAAPNDELLNVETSLTNTDASSLHAMQQRCDSLVLKQDIDKTAALEILRQHFNLETFYRMQAEKNAEIARLKHSLDMTRLNGELRAQVSDMAVKLADATRTSDDMRRQLQETNGAFEELSKKAAQFETRLETMESGFAAIELRSRGRR